MQAKECYGTFQNFAIVLQKIVNKSFNSKLVMGCRGEILKRKFKKLDSIGSGHRGLELLECTVELFFGQV